MKQFIDESIAELDRLYEHYKPISEAMFPHHPKAAETWARLQSGRGGIVETVEVLGLHEERSEYLDYFYRACEQGNHMAAAASVGSMVKFCLAQIEESFYMFR